MAGHPQRRCFPTPTAAENYRLLCSIVAGPHRPGLCIAAADNAAASVFVCGLAEGAAEIEVRLEQDPLSHPGDRARQVAQLFAELGREGWASTCFHCAYGPTGASAAFRTTIAWHEEIEVYGAVSRLFRRLYGTDLTTTLLCAAVEP